MKKTTRIPKSIEILKKLISKELSTLVSNLEVLRRKPADVMLAILFEDGHIHTVLPHIEVVRSIHNVLSSKLEEYDRSFVGDLEIPQEDESELLKPLGENDIVGKEIEITPASESSDEGTQKELDFKEEEEDGQLSIVDRMEEK